MTSQSASQLACEIASQPASQPACETANETASQLEKDWDSEIPNSDELISPLATCDEEKNP